MCYEILRGRKGRLLCWGYFANTVERARITHEVRRRRRMKIRILKQRVAGAGQVLGTASLFRVRVREQPPSITGGS